MKTGKKANEVKRWICDHKVELIVGGVVIAGVCILIYFKGDAIGKLILGKKVVKQPVPKGTIPGELTLRDTTQVVEKVIETNSIANTAADPLQVSVNGFVRNLHPGWSPTPEKVVEAMESGITLMPGQTWVKPFMRTYHKAAL